MAIKTVQIIDYLSTSSHATRPAREGRINTDHLLFAHAVESRGSEAIMLVVLRTSDAGGHLLLHCAGTPNELD